MAWFYLLDDLFHEGTSGVLRFESDDIGYVIDQPKGSKVFLAKRPTWRYWKNPKTRRMYCYSVRRTVAGYFLGWEEKHYPGPGERRRTNWIFYKRKATVMEIMKRRWEASLKRTVGE